MRVQSIRGSRYFVQFIDDHSRWAKIYFLKSKSEVLQATKEFIAMVENQTGLKVKCIQSDNAKEYVSHEFDEYIKKRGITRRLTIPHNPEQNGIAERRNRTIMEMARCLLIQSGLPNKFWAEAVNTANYLRNRCPSKSVQGKTLFEVWSGKIPDVNHFEEFGSRVLVLNRTPGVGKLDSKCDEGVFLGYSEESKGYRVWLTEKQKVVTTRDIKVCGIPLPNDDVHEEFGPKIEDSNYEDDDRTKHPGYVIIEPNPVETDSTVPDVGVQVEPENRSRSRKRGRPAKVRTGKRGRPRKSRNVPENEVYYANDVEQSLLSEIPMNVAMKSPEINEWKEAMVAEIKSILVNNTWDIVDRPTQEIVIGSRIVLRNKYNSDGTLERRKARLVAQGFAQQPGIHYGDTFAPVARFGSVRLMVSLATSLKMEVRHLDVTTAYLNGKLDEKIYMEAPKELEDILRLISETENNAELSSKADKMLIELLSGDKVCFLKKALYGLRQAGRSWHIKLNEVLKSFGAKQSTADPCLYYVGAGKNFMMIATYVDDIIIASKNNNDVSKFTSYLSNHFKIKDIGEINHCLGVEFSRNKDAITMHQRGYICDILRRFGMQDCNAASTPLDPNVKFTIPEGEPTDEEKRLPYRELVGCLTYAAITTRPDISFAVSLLGQFNSCFRSEHWKAAKRVLRYLKGTADVGLMFKADTKPLKGYIDADWGNCPIDRISQSGYVFILNGSPISWDSRKQRTVALSSTEAEYMALTEGVKEAVYLQKILKEINIGEPVKITLFNDNMSALKLAENSMYHGRSKHIDIRHHYIRDVLKSENFVLGHVPTSQIVADFLTKGLPKVKHVSCLNMSGMYHTTSQLS